MPLFIFSPAFFTFKKVITIIPTLAQLMLLNPLTYIVEGLRVALLGSGDYLPLTTCLMGILIGIMFMYVRLYYGFYKQLDPA